MMLSKRGMIRIRMPAMIAMMGCKCAIPMTMMDSPGGGQWKRNGETLARFHTKSLMGYRETGGENSRGVSLDFRKIRHRPGRVANLVQQPEAVLAQRPVLDIDGDLVEERVDARAELG